MLDFYCLIGLAPMMTVLWRGSQLLQETCSSISNHKNLKSHGKKKEFLADEQSDSWFYREWCSVKTNFETFSRFEEFGA